MSVEQQDATRGKTPRRTTRRSSATPVREVSPPRSTRGASTAVQGASTTRRSTRAASKRVDQPRDVVNNAALPEVQTRQSYAYGSSKTPLLPEQLHVRDTMTMKQVADQMQSAVDRAEHNLDSHATHLESQNRTKTQPNKNQPNTQLSREPSPPASETTEVQKKQRTAAWASSLDSGQLDDIVEEDQPQIDTPETRRTEPSSFPSGIFDQSYQYERGLRPPRRPPNTTTESFGSRLGAALGSTLDRFIASFYYGNQCLLRLYKVVLSWTLRCFASVSHILHELPESKAFSIAMKTCIVVLLTGFMSYALCFGYTRFLCNPSSASRMAHAIESWCGQCRSADSYVDLPSNPHPDLRKLTQALKHVDGQIRNIESRLNSRLDSKVSALHTDIDDLRKEQSNLIQQVESVSKQASQQTQSANTASPFVPKINYFSPANGAIVNAKLTSPTRQVPIALPFRLAARMFGIHKYKSHNPIVALEPWHDVGDCWCAAATAPGQDSIRLGVGTREYIFPTELVIEHPPKEVTLTPESAPKRVELWAEFSHLAEQGWEELGVSSMTMGRDAAGSPFGNAWGLIASVEYDLGAHAGHMQRFNLDVNQYGELKHSAQDYALRVRSTHGGEYGCLYRVRLHGVPVVQSATDEAIEAQLYEAEEGQAADPMG